MFCLLLSLLNRRNIRRIALTLPHTPLPRSGFRTCPKFSHRYHHHSAICVP